LPTLPPQAHALGEGIELLPLTGLGFDLSVRGHVIASIEPLRGWIVGRLIGLPHLRLRLGGLLRALVA
jgi:hypothetical protein